MEAYYNDGRGGMALVKVMTGFTNMMTLKNMKSIQAVMACGHMISSLQKTARKV